jgi:hypothetical protein
MIQRIFAVLLLCGVFFISCAGNNSSPIGSPSLTKDSVTNAGVTNAGLTNASGANAGLTNGTSGGASSHNLWGYWSVRIDPETMTADIVPLRSAEFTCNVTRFMQKPVSPVNMVSIGMLPGSIPADGYFEVRVTLKHPFPGLNQYRGFDVRGIFMSDGSYATGHDSTATYAGPSDSILLNADGLTRWWNSTEFTSFETIFGFTKGKLAPPAYPTATLNGYKYFADDLTEDEPAWQLNPDSRGTFPTSPGIYSRIYKIQFAMVGGQPDFFFNYAVDASWDQPDPAGVPSYDIQYFSQSANMMEPYCISVADNGSTAFYEGPGETGGNLKLDIRVYDWQAASNPLGVPGEISALWLESPVLVDPIDVLPSATVLADGPTSSIFQVDLGGLNLTKSGDESLLVYAESKNPNTYEPQISGGSTFAFPSNPLGSYYMTSVNIKDQGFSTDPPIVISIDPNHGESNSILTGVIVTGENFNDGAQVELRKTGLPTIEATNEVVAGGTSITCDLDLTLAEAGLRDVVVINPDLQEGVLTDGFTVDCPSGVHSYDGKHYMVDDSIEWKYTQRCDMTVLDTGPYKGQAVLRRSFIIDTEFTSPYVRFDPDNPANAAPVDFFSVPARYPTDTNGNYLAGMSQIDQNPVNGQIGIVNGRMFETVQFVDQEGAPLPAENIIVTDPLTKPGYFVSIPGMDFDAQGNLWMIANVGGNPDGNAAEPRWQIRKYEVQSSSPYYIENMAEREEVTGELDDPDIYPSILYYVADIAISYTENSMFVLAGQYIGGTYYDTQGYIYKFDLNTTPATMVQKTKMPGPIQTIRGLSKCSKFDIEIDHVDPALENCRLVILYQVATSSGVREVHVMRMDTNLNILADDMVQTDSDMWDAPMAIGLNVDTDKRNFVSMDMALGGALNDFFYFPMPGSGW